MQNDVRGRHLIIKESRNKYLAYELAPMAECVVLGCHVKTNSHGFRDKEYAIEKGGKFRIAAIGDSITFGTDLAAEKRYSELLEALFAAANKNADVINMGCPGYNIIQVINLLTDKGLKFLPDVLVYCYNLNDLMDTGPGMEYIREHIFVKNTSLLKLRIFQFISVQLYKFKMVKDFYETVKPVKDIKEFYSSDNEGDLSLVDNVNKLVDLLKRYGNYFTNKIQMDSIIKSSKGYKLPYYATTYVSQQKIERLEWAFAKLRELADQYRFRAVIVIVPELQKRNGEYLISPIHEIVDHIAKRNKLTVIDMYEDFDEYGFENLKISKWDTSHPNPAGHRIIARRLYGLIDTEY
ncbi:SGNH/GDSL hydrolase family protein [Elusimicrobiota bacterium]